MSTEPIIGSEMIVEIPDHYGITVCAALVGHGAFAIELNGYVPAFVHVLADTFDKLGGADDFLTDYWNAMTTVNPKIKELVKNR